MVHASEPQVPAHLTGRTISNNSIILGERIGLGGFGAVYVAHHASDKRHRFAVKVLPKPSSDSQRVRRNREIRLHQKVSSLPSVVGLREVIHEAPYTYLVMDYCKHGDLLQYINDTPLFGKKVVKRKLDLFLHVIDAVEQCHAAGVYHRDLKPENILLDSTGTRIYLADFGLATDQSLAEDVQSGTTEYMSPECLADFTPLGDGAPYLSAPNDVWGLSVLLYALMFSMRPWEKAAIGARHFDAYILDPNRQNHFLYTRNISKPANDIFTRAFDVDPSSRCTLAELRARVLSLRDGTIPFFLTAPEGDALRARYPRSNPLNEDMKTEVLEHYRNVVLGIAAVEPPYSSYCSTSPPPPPRLVLSPADSRSSISSFDSDASSLLHTPENHAAGGLPPIGVVGDDALEADRLDLTAGGSYAGFVVVDGTSGKGSKGDHTTLPPRIRKRDFVKRIFSRRLGGMVSA